MFYVFLGFHKSGGCGVVEGRLSERSRGVYGGFPVVACMLRQHVGVLSLCLPRGSSLPVGMWWSLLSATCIE